MRMIRYPPSRNRYPNRPARRDRILVATNSIDYYLYGTSTT